MKTLDEVIRNIEDMWVCPSSDEAEYCELLEVRDEALHYLKEYAEKKEELVEAVQKETNEFLRASRLVWICTEILQEKIAKVTDYTEIVSGYEAEVGGKCGACGNWVYDELPYCPHCGKRLDWGEHE